MRGAPKGVRGEEKGDPCTHSQQGTNGVALILFGRGRGAP